MAVSSVAARKLMANGRKCCRRPEVDGKWP
jgi:hypothetical protein